MRRIAIWSACLVAGVLALAVILLLTLDVNQFRGTIQGELEARLRRTVKLGRMGLKLFPPAIRVEGFEIGESPEFSSRVPFAAAGDMQVRVGLAALLQRRIQVDSFRLRRPAVELIRNRAGKWNTATLGAPSGGGESPPLSLAELVIEDGRLAVTDLQAGKPRAVYDHIDVSLRDFAPGKRFSLECGMRLPGQDALRLSAAGAGTFQNRVLSMEPLTLKLGGLAAGGRLRADLGRDPAAVAAEFRTDNIAAAEWMKLAAALGAGSGLSGSGSLSLAAKLEGPANAVAAALSIAVPSASLKTPAMEKPLELNSARLEWNVPPAGSGAGTLSARSLAFKEFALTDLKASCRYDGGTLRLDPVSARGFGGTGTGSITLDLKGRQPAYTVQMKLERVDANQLLAAATPVRQVVFGTLAADSDLRISAAPGQDLVRGLNGDVRLALTDGKLAGVSLLNELASLARLAGYAKQQQTFTDFVKLSGTLRLRDGVANTDDLALEFAGGNLGAAGEIGLAAQTLNLRVTALLNKETSGQWLGGGLGGLMSTVLANRNGELVIPALVTGTFSKPVFAPDAARLARMKLDGLLPGSGGARGVIGSLAGAVTGKKKEEAGQEKEPLRGLLDALRGK